MKPIARFGVVLPTLILILVSGTSSAQAPASLVCTFERIAVAEMDSTGKLSTSTDVSSGQLVLANLSSDSPTATGNVGAVKLEVLRRSSDMIWLAEMKPNEVASTATLFLKTGVVMFTKHETLHTVGGDAPFGFVEIGRCKPLR
jgi:hypothetical protein